MRFKMKFIVPLLALSLVMVTNLMAQGNPTEGEQVLFIIDDSSSMTSIGADQERPKYSRWAILQEVYPAWMSRLSSSTLTGALSVGGECGEPPRIRIPLTLDKDAVTRALNHATPVGATNLNAALQNAPALFDPNIQGGKRIVLLSDGLNNCSPQVSTCQIAMDLFSKHNIVIDVVAWITEPGMEKELRCAAEATGGTFIAPKGLAAWKNIPLPAMNPWRYIIMTMGFLTLVSAARILYRHIFHVLRWSPGHAVLCGGFLLVFGTLAIFLVLFTTATYQTAGLGLVLVIMLCFLLGREQKNATFPPSSWTVGMMLFFLYGPLTPLAQAIEVQSLNGFNSTASAGQTLHHHFLILDASGSVKREFPHMKTLIGHYAELYVKPGEEITLATFGNDESGSVKEISTFVVPEYSPTATLMYLLGGLEIKHANKTRTFFKPIADFLNKRLKDVRLEPVVVVISDGSSDGLAVNGQSIDGLPFIEIPFDRLGKRGIYSAPGVTGWKVAVDGGNDLDLGQLFRRPIQLPQRQKAGLSSSTPPAIDPCLLDPSMLMETEENIVLTPSWNPFSAKRRGVLTIWVRNACVNRFREFRVEIRNGKQTLQVGSVGSTLIGTEKMSFSFPIMWEGLQTTGDNAVVQLVLNQGPTSRMIYPSNASSIPIVTPTYMGIYGIWLIMVACILSVMAVVVTASVRRYYSRKQNRPGVLGVLGGSMIQVLKNQAVSIGGNGCQIVVPGVPDKLQLASIEWTGSGEPLFVIPSQPVKCRINGMEVVGSGKLAIGSPIQFMAPDGAIFNITLISGKQKDIGFGGPILTADPLGHTGDTVGSFDFDFDKGVKSGFSTGSFNNSIGVSSSGSGFII